MLSLSHSPRVRRIRWTHADSHIHLPRVVQSLSQTQILDIWDASPDMAASISPYLHDDVSVVLDCPSWAGLQAFVQMARDNPMLRVSVELLIVDTESEGVPPKCNMSEWARVLRRNCHFRALLFARQRIFAVGAMLMGEGDWRDMV